MRFLSIVLLLVTMPGCGSGTQPAKSPAEEASGAKTPEADFRQDHSLAPGIIVLESVKPQQRDESSAVRYGLTRADLERLISTLPGIQQAIPVSTTDRDVCHGDKSAAARVVGSTRGLDHVFQLEIARGRFFTDSDKGGNVAVIGADVARKLYPVENPVGKNIHIGDHVFRIVGQTKAGKTPLQPPQGITTGTDSDVYIPMLTMRQRFGDRLTASEPESRRVDEVELNQIWIAVTNLPDVDKTAEIIRSLLEKFHGTRDYSITLGTRQPAQGAE